MARKRASMREGPLAELFRATEAAQKQAERQGGASPPPASEQERLALDETVEYTPDFAEPAETAPAAEPPPRKQAKKRPPKAEAGQLNSFPSASFSPTR